MEINDTVFHGVYLAADAPEVLFRRIEDCAEIAILGRNSYTDRQLCKMQFASSSQRGFMSGRLKNGIAYSPRRRRGLHYVR